MGKKRNLSALLDGYQQFMTDGLNALIEGESEYSDTPADSRPPLQLIDEVRQELVDTSVWSYLTYRRVNALAKKVARLEATVEPKEKEYVCFDADELCYYGPQIKRPRPNISCPCPDDYE